MRPIEFPEQNKQLQKPASMKDEECLPLNIFTDGSVCVSCWEFSKEDIDNINKTGKIYLGVLSGQTQPPVWLETDSPFIEAT